MSGFSVTQPGLLSLLHDRGRYGAHKLGLTTGGPLDFVAFDWANRLLGNDANATCLEVSFGGLVLQAEVDTSFVITGATAPCKWLQKPSKSPASSAISCRSSVDTAQPSSYPALPITTAVPACANWASRSNPDSCCRSFVILS